MIKVLHMFTTLDNGGVESFLYNYYEAMDKEKIEFDFIVSGEKKGFLEEKMEKMNSSIFHVSKFKKNPFKQLKQVNKIIKENNYDIVHIHGYKSIIGLILAKKNKVKIRIAHSHMAYVKENVFQKIIRKITVLLINCLATDKFACGIDAAKWLYGKKKYDNNEIKIINNAVDLKKFKYNEKNRIKIRKEFKIKNDEILLCDVARLTKQKNQIFLLDLIENIKNESKKYKLLLVGNGEDEQKLKEFVNINNLEDYVIFAGIRTDVNEILSGIDFFLLPSLYEGLPVVLAEVQASGAYCIVSDTVTREVAVTNTIYYLSINNYKEWENKINNLLNNDNDRNLGYIDMQNGKYDISYQANHLFDFYSNRLKDLR